MVALPAATVDMSHIAAKGLRLISLIDRQSDAPASGLLNEEEMSKRNFIYEQLGDPRVIVVGKLSILLLLSGTYLDYPGRVGHQRRIRRLIRVISYNSPVHPAVWAECYSRWRALSQPVYEALNDGYERVDLPTHFFGTEPVSLLGTLIQPFTHLISQGHEGGVAKLDSLSCNIVWCLHVGETGFVSVAEGHSNGHDPRQDTSAHQRPCPCGELHR